MAILPQPALALQETFVLKQRHVPILINLLIAVAAVTGARSLAHENFLLDIFAVAVAMAVSALGLAFRTHWW